MLNTSNGSLRPVSMSGLDRIWFTENMSSLCANMRETTLSFFKVEGTESFHDRVNRKKS